MNAKTIRMLIDIELTRTEFEMLADYADQTRQPINVAAADMTLIGLTLGPKDIHEPEYHENFAPAASNGNPLVVGPGASEPPRGGDAGQSESNADAGTEPR